MEATLCLQRHPLSISPLLFTSNFSNPSAISRHVGRFRGSSISLTTVYMCGSHGLVTCSLNRFSKSRRNNNGDEDNKPKSMVGVAAVLACVLGIISYSSRMHPRAMAAVSPKQQIRVSTINGPGGKSALNYFLSMIQNIISSQPKKKIISSEGRKFSRFLRRSWYVKLGESLSTIKQEALKLIKKGKADQAEVMVKEQYEFAKKQMDLEKSYQLDMLLVEILIFQGKYEDASHHECLDHESQNHGTLPSDSRLSLYKAIICTMMSDEDNNTEAKKWWEEFKKTLDG